MPADRAIVPLVIIELLQERDEQSRRLRQWSGRDGAEGGSVALHQLDQNGQPPGRFGRGRMHQSSGAAMDGRTVFPALA